MSKMRDLNRGDVLPASLTDALQEFIGSAALNFDVVITNATTITVPAGPANGQAAIAISGAWRYRSTDVAAAVGGGPAAGDLNVFVTGSANAFADTPAPDTDTTNYDFGLEIRTAAQGNPTTALMRRIGVLRWDGAAIIAFKSDTPAIRSKLRSARTVSGWAAPTNLRRTLDRNSFTAYDLLDFLATINYDMQQAGIWP